MKRFKELFESPPGLMTPNPVTFTASAHGPKMKIKPEKEKAVSEQYREKGRFKPTIPHNVPNVLAASPKKVNEDFGKPTPSAEEVAKKHGVSLDVINKQLEMGIKVEKEHTNDAKMAREIALDHLNEKPNYYSKLKKYVEMTDVEYQSAGAGARTLVDKPNKDPMKTYNQLKKEQRDDTLEKNEMVESQLHFMKYACDEILEFINMGGKVEEWYQVKVAKVFAEFESLHAYMEGESRRLGMKEEVEKHPFVAVHARKGTHQTHGSTSYEAAQNAAKHWKMKNTAGIDVYRADKKHIPEEVEQIAEDNLGDIAKSHGMEFKRTTYGASMKHPKKGEISINRYGEWHHYPAGSNSSKAHGNSANKFSSLQKHLSSLKEDVEQIDEAPVVIKTNKEIGAKVTSVGPGGKETVIKTDPEFEKAKQGVAAARLQQKAIAGKYGSGYSTARHLARQAMKKQIEKMKPVKESLEESRKAEIVKEIVKKKKNDKDNSESFQKDPVLSSEITKA